MSKKSNKTEINFTQTQTSGESYYNEPISDYGNNISYVNTLVTKSGNDFDLDNSTIEIPISLYKKLEKVGIIDITGVRNYNVGNSNYSEHLIQPWVIWNDYPELTAWDYDIIKRVLRTKRGEDRILDYEKIIHCCKERIRQLNLK